MDNTLSFYERMDLCVLKHVEFCLNPAYIGPEEANHIRFKDFVIRIQLCNHNWELYRKIENDYSLYHCPECRFTGYPVGE